MLKILSKIWEGLKTLLNSPQFLTLLQQLVLKFLGKFISVRGWLIKTIVREFSEEVIEVANDTLDYIEIKKKARDTINETDRDSATTTINDIMR